MVEPYIVHAKARSKKKMQNFKFAAALCVTGATLIALPAAFVLPGHSAWPLWSNEVQHEGRDVDYFYGNGAFTYGVAERTVNSDGFFSPVIENARFSAKMSVGQAAAEFAKTHSDNTNLYNGGFFWNPKPELPGVFVFFDDAGENSIFDPISDFHDHGRLDYDFQYIPQRIVANFLYFSAALAFAATYASLLIVFDSVAVRNFDVWTCSGFVASGICGIVAYAVPCLNLNPLFMEEDDVFENPKRERGSTVLIAGSVLMLLGGIGYIAMRPYRGSGYKQPPEQYELNILSGRTKKPIR